MNNPSFLRQYWPVFVDLAWLLFFSGLMILLWISTP